MVIYKVTSAFTDAKKRTKYYYRYFSTLESAEHYAKEASCETNDDYGGIFEMEPNKDGAFVVTRCIKAW